MSEPDYLIVHDDDAILVVDKGPALVSVPPETPTGDSLLERLNAEHPMADGRRIHAVHRLDVGVSGLLVFARAGRLAERLREQFAARKPERVYTALVAGVLRDDAGTFRSRLGTGRGMRRFVMDADRRPHERRRRDDGEIAVTHWRAVRRFADATEVEVRLDTGRRHQIRVQFAEAGHPLLGDRRYGGRDALHPAWTAQRIALHAGVLGFMHPVSGEMVRFESPPPPEFAAFAAAARPRAPSGWGEPPA